MSYRYLVINRVDDRIEELKLNELAERIKSSRGEKLVFGYDLHAGFNIPSNIEFRDLLKVIDRKIKIDFAVIDERRQSNDKPYSPTSVCVVIGDDIRRKSIYPHRHTFVSEIPLNKDKIIGAYRELLGAEFDKYSELLGAIEGNSVGDFLAKLAEEILINCLQGLENVTIKNVRFDKFQGITANAHPVIYHKDHDILYLGQHKAVNDENTLDFLVDRFGQLGEKPYFLIIPIEPKPYFIISDPK